MQFVISLVLVLAAASVAGAGPLDHPGAMKALNCSACHGFAGQSIADTMPSLAGQPPGYLKSQMTLFKQDRRSPGDANLKALKAMMQGLPDSTIEDLAAYYSSLR